MKKTTKLQSNDSVSRMIEELEYQSHRNYALLSNGACTYLAWRPSGEHDYFTTVLAGQLNGKEKDCNGAEIVCRHISGFVYDNDLLNGEGDSNIDKFNSLGSELKRNPYFKYNHYDSKWPGYSYSAVVNNNKIGELPSEEFIALCKELNLKIPGYVVAEDQPSPCTVV